MTEVDNNLAPPDLTRFLESSDVSIDDKLNVLRSQRARRDEAEASMDEKVVRRIVQRMSESKQVADQQYAINKELRKLVKQLTEPPWPVARFIELAGGNGTMRANVMVGGAKHQVGIDKDVDAATLGAGDEVYLNAGRNAIVGRSALGPTPTGDCCVVERALSDGRFIIKDRDVESVLAASSIKQ